MCENPQASSILDLVKMFVDAERRVYPISAAFLFGSWAYGQPREDSDIDVGLVIDGDVSFEDEQSISLAAWETNPKLETHVFSREYFDKAHRSIVYDIKEKGIQIE
jgi:predicted nucleotidyltransferase